MKRNLWVKLLVFNLLLAVVDIILFSKGLVGLSVTSEETIVQALSITLIFINVILFFYVNYKLLNKSNHYNISSFSEYKDFIEALNGYRNKKLFLGEINETVDQIERFSRKKNSLNMLLIQNFGEDSNLDSINFAISKAERALQANVKSILNGLAIFDQREYERISVQRPGLEVDKEKYHLIMDNVAYVRNMIKSNEGILLEIDKLMKEISRINDSDAPNDLSSIRDLISSMESLHSNKNDDLDNLKKKYEEEI